MTFDDLLKAFTTSPLPAITAGLFLACITLFGFLVRSYQGRGRAVERLTADFALKLDKKTDQLVAVVTQTLKNAETTALLEKQVREGLDRIKDFLDHLEPILNKLTGRRVKPTSTQPSITPVPALGPGPVEKVP